MFRIFKKNIYLSMLCGSVLECRKYKSTFGFSCIIVFIYRCSYTHKEAINFFRFPLFALILAFLWNIVDSIININSKFLPA